MGKIDNIPWVDKYRPLKLSQIIQQKEIITVFQNMVLKKDIPHLLFYGPPGTGKTSTIYALAFELFGNEKINERVIELNASDERGISVVRHKITKFAKLAIRQQSTAVYPPIKIIILDEADAMTHEAQSALRKLMETAKNTRFCFICNYKSKIIEPIESRCACFRFRCVDKVLLQDKISMIAERENLNINSEAVSLITQIANGDARRAIMILHNLKYIYNNRMLVRNDVIKVTSYIDKLSFKVSNLKNMEVGLIKNIANSIINDGYPINYVLEHIRDSIINNKNIKDINKGNMLINIANTEAVLIDGGNEYLQLLALLTYISCEII